MRVKVTVVVEVEVPYDDPERIAREVDTIALHGLDARGFQPVSCGYGYTRVPERSQ